jgi:hypothetical protein
MNKSSKSERSLETISNPAANPSEVHLTMAQQRTVDLLKNIERHAPIKKIKLFKEAFMNAEPLKIKKFNEKCYRNHQSLKYMTQRHDHIQKSNAIKKILQEEQKKEVEVIAD